jgi:hypothetical protein
MLEAASVTLLLSIERVVWMVLGAGLALTIAVLIASGRLSFSGLLTQKTGPFRGTMSPARVQLLASTILASAAYIARVFGTGPSGSLPEFPATWLGFLGGSHVVYVAGKWLSIASRLSIRPIR